MIQNMLVQIRIPFLFGVKACFFGDWLNFNSFFFKNNCDNKNMYMDKQFVY